MPPKKPAPRPGAAPQTVKHAGHVLLIIDVQRGFITPDTRHIPAAVEALQADFEHVFATRFENLPGSPYRRLLDWTAFTPGSADTELAFTPRPGAQVLTKSVYSAVDGDLLDALAYLSAGTVHLCGIATDNCVLKTAADLFEAGLRPVVLAHACASHGGADAHDAGITVLKRLIGEAQVIGEAR